MNEYLAALIGLDPTVWASLLTYMAAGLSMLGFGFGTVFVSNVVQGDTFYCADLIASATTGQSLTTPHGLGSIAAVAGSPFANQPPLDFHVQPTSALGRASQWIATVNTTNVTVTKLSVAASAGTPVQARLVVKLPHSLVR